MRREERLDQFRHCKRQDSGGCRDTAKGVDRESGVINIARMCLLPYHRPFHKSGKLRSIIEHPSSTSLGG